MSVERQAGLQQGAHEVPVGHRVQTVARDLAEAEFGRNELAIHVERHARQRARAQRADVGHGVGVQDVVHVAPVHLEQRQEVVAERDRLRDLEVCESRGDGFRFLFGPPRQHAQQVQDRAHQAQAETLAIESKVRGDLIVAAARHVQAAAVVTDTRRQFPLDEAVDVLVVCVSRWAARHLEFRQQRIERRRQGLRAAGRNNSLAAQHCGVRAAGRDVLAVHPPVNGVRARKGARDLRRRFVEPSTPHERGLSRQPGRDDAVRRLARRRVHPVLRRARPR